LKKEQWRKQPEAGKDPDAGYKEIIADHKANN